MQREEGYRSDLCAYLQMRGSIPTYWYQETSVTMPKPPILINRVDPDYLATQVRTGMHYVPCRRHLLTDRVASVGTLDGGVHNYDLLYG